MDINTGKTSRDSDSLAVPVPPDRTAARKKAAQKVPRARYLAGRLVAALKIVAVLGVVILLAAGAFYSYRYVYTSDLFALRNISIDGCKHLDPGKVDTMIRQNFQANLLRIDLDKLRSYLEQVPWIRKAEIRRLLPASLRISIQERVPSVIAEIGDELELLDNEGVLLDQYGPGYGKMDVPVFRGLQGENTEAYAVLQQENAARVRRGVQVLEELEGGSSEFTRAISEIDLSDPANVRVLLVNDTAEISLGDKDFLKRFEDFLAQYPRAKAQYGEMISVDLRFYPQIVYRPKRTAANSGTPGAGGGSGPK
jgi:cell division protein FtsQ